MTPSQKQRWIDALRSGKYKQTTGWLNRNDEYCCLGVACDVFKDEVSLRVEHGSYEGFGSIPSYEFTLYDDMSGNLPEKMGEFLGVDQCGRLPSSSIPELGSLDDGRPLSLVGLNDDEGYSFSRIADVIEKYVPANEPEPEQPDQKEQTK